MFELLQESIPAFVGPDTAHKNALPRHVVGRVYN